VDFLLRKTGKTWDDVAETSATIYDIDNSAVDDYLKAAIKSGRLPDVEGISLADLLEKLRRSEEGKLKKGSNYSIWKGSWQVLSQHICKNGTIW
jgi:ATP-dependent DNA helicase RecG